MDTTVTALQNLYTALGGEAATVADLVTIPDMINAIAALEASKAESNSEESNSEESNSEESNSEESNSEE